MRDKWKAKKGLSEEAFFDDLGYDQTMTSSAFKRFSSSFFQDPESMRDGLDIEALTTLAAQERHQAEKMLIHCLPDARAIIGLGALRSRRAEPELL